VVTSVEATSVAVAAAKPTVEAEDVVFEAAEARNCMLSI